MCRQLKKYSFSNQVGKLELLKESKSKINNLMKRDPQSFLIQLILSWVLIFASIWIALYFKNIFVMFIALLILTVEDYSQAQLSHHKFFMTNKDQNLFRKPGKKWEFPIPISRLLKLFRMYIICFNLWKMINGKKLSFETNIFKRPNRSPIWVRPAYFFLGGKKY